MTVNSVDGVSKVIAVVSVRRRVSAGVAGKSAGGEWRTAVNREGATIFAGQAT